MADRHAVRFAYRPKSAELAKLELVAISRGLTVRQAIAEAIDDYLQAHDVGRQLADLDAATRSMRQLRRVDDSAGLIAEARAATA